MKRLRTLFFAFAGLACLAAASPALADSRLVPEQPYAFDPVNLRMTVDSCIFAEDAVTVAYAQGAIEVRLRQNNCLVPGPPRIVDIRLGSLAPGAWRVIVRPANGDIVLPPSETIDFQVLERPAIAVFPPPPRPLADHSGQWYRPAESGWGLSFHQSATHVAFAAWYVYDAAGTPIWFTIQQGRWENATRWTGAVYRTSGPPFFAPVFDPAGVSIAPVGQATLDFEQQAGEEGYATFTYGVTGLGTGTKRITRLAF